MSQGQPIQLLQEIPYRSEKKTDVELPSRRFGCPKAVRYMRSDQLLMVSIHRKL